MLGRMEISLKEVTKETLGEILRLKVAGNQESFVADNATSIAQAHYSSDAWFRGIYAGDEPVGFVMMSLKPLKPEFYLWRFMIDKGQQGKGHGSKALALIIDHVRTKPEAKELLLHVVDVENGARPLYEKFGFVSTGRVEDGELVMSLQL